MDNEQIVKRFVEAKAVDFRAIGSVIADLGPELAVSDLGFRGVLIGKPFIIACLMPGPELAQAVGELTNIANLGSTLNGD
jgi:hypothetical protein